MIDQSFRKFAKISRYIAGSRKIGRYARVLDFISRPLNGMNKAGDILTKAGGIGASIGPATGAAAPFVEAGSAGAIAIGQGLKGASSIGRRI